ncbi:MAG TPA: isochorismatase family cysteine hydrolase [Gemmatimonadaceae bacterium]|nr:isochorismatase family cysteine hydrolase [Gemmatimonadaceae bacterium]
MPHADGRNPDLHGNAPDKSPVALLLIDVINALDFEHGVELLEQALPMAHRLAALKRRAAKAGIPAVYVNDNFGRWQSDLNQVLDHVLHDGVPGQPVAEILHPEKNDYFVLKPKHSGFFSTQLDILLDYLGARTLIVTGIQANICVLFTANDAYMRDYALVVPSDCVASTDPREAEHALEQMRIVLKAQVAPSTELDLEALIGQAERPSAQPARRDGGQERSNAARALP